MDSNLNSSDLDETNNVEPNVTFTNLDSSNRPNMFSIWPNLSVRYPLQVIPEHGRFSLFGRNFSSPISNQVFRSNMSNFPTIRCNTPPFPVGICSLRATLEHDSRMDIRRSNRKGIRARMGDEVYPKIRKYSSKIMPKLLFKLNDQTCKPATSYSKSTNKLSISEDIHFIHPDNNEFNFDENINNNLKTNDETDLEDMYDDFVNETEKMYKIFDLDLNIKVKFKVQNLKLPKLSDIIYETIMASLTKSNLKLKNNQDNINKMNQSNLKSKLNINDRVDNSHFINSNIKDMESIKMQIEKVQISQKAILEIINILFWNAHSTSNLEKEEDQDSEENELDVELNYLTDKNGQVTDDEDINMNCSKVNRKNTSDELRNIRENQKSLKITKEIMGIIQTKLNEIRDIKISMNSYFSCIEELSHIENQFGYDRNDIQNLKKLIQDTHASLERKAKLTCGDIEEMESEFVAKMKLNDSLAQNHHEPSAMTRNISALQAYNSATNNWSNSCSSLNTTPSMPTPVSLSPSDSNSMWRSQSSTPNVLKSDGVSSEQTSLLIPALLRLSQDRLFAISLLQHEIFKHLLSAVLLSQQLGNGQNDKNDNQSDELSGVQEDKKKLDALMSDIRMKAREFKRRSHLFEQNRKRKLQNDQRIGVPDSTQESQNDLQTESTNTMIVDDRSDPYNDNMYKRHCGMDYSNN